MIKPYRIGWWTHRWWPDKGLLMCIATGNQLSPRADNGDRHVGRRPFFEVAVRRLRLIRRPHRPWQAEADGTPMFARRAFTPAGAAAKMQHDIDHTTGVVTGHPIDSPWQLRRLARANAERVRAVRRGR
jgi:hypothetical protein